MTVCSSGCVKAHALRVAVPQTRLAWFAVLFALSGVRFTEAACGQPSRKKVSCSPGAVNGRTAVSGSANWEEWRSSLNVVCLVCARCMTHSSQTLVGRSGIEEIHPSMSRQIKPLWDHDQASHTDSNKLLPFLLYDVNHATSSCPPSLVSRRALLLGDGRVRQHPADTTSKHSQTTDLSLTHSPTVRPTLPCATACRP